MNLMDKYRAKLEEKQRGIADVHHGRQILPEGEQVDDLLRTPMAELRKPIFIESAYLKDTFYLVANEAQSREIEQGRGVAYLPEEVQTLLAKSVGMDEGDLKDYLAKVHAVKKTFGGVRIQ